MKLSLLIAAAAVAVVQASSSQLAIASIGQRATQRPSDEERLYRLFASSDRALLLRDPLEALLRGRNGSNDNFGDYITDRYFADQRRAAEHDLAQLRTVNRAALSPEAQVAYDSFEWQRRSDLEGLAPSLVRLTKLQPLEQVRGFPAVMPEISAGDSAVPFVTVPDYEANLRRLEGYALYLDRARQRLRQGLAAHVTEPKEVIEHVADQLDEATTKGVDDSPFFLPVKIMPRTFAPANRRRIASEYRTVLSRRLMPAERALSDFIRHVYLPKARSKPGLCALAGGARLYVHLVVEFTTTKMTPRQIHELGLSEVARIETAMDDGRRKVGFRGSLRQFADYMRTSPRFAPRSVQELSQDYRAIQAKVEAQLPEHFGSLPHAKLVAKPLSGLGAATAPNASYSQGPPDGSRPGVFHFNVSDLPSRRTFYTESLFLHEGEPGHHLQDNIAAENQRLPAFLRFDGNIAFGEGWALYAEGLGSEFGLYHDPYQLYGRYTTEVFRAARLVVDTGIHAFGWSRQQAIDYLLAHTALTRTVIEQEVDRYIADPGQALAYKIGELRILALRHRAEQALGGRFDERAFHHMVLEDGRIPLAVLDRKGDRWIAAQRDK